MVSKCSLSRRNFLGFCTVLLVEEGKTSIGATTLAHRSHGGVSVCKEYKISAEEISWPTLADIQPTCGLQTCNMVFNITLAGPTCRPTCCERVTCECWPTSDRHAMQTQKSSALHSLILSMSFIIYICMIFDST